MPGTGQFGNYFVAPGKTGVAKVSLALAGQPYLEPVCIAPFLLGRDMFLNFRLLRSTLTDLHDNNAFKLVVDNPPNNQAAKYSVQFGWFKP